MDSLKTLQKKLKDVERGFELLRNERLYDTPAWYSKSAEAAVIRKQLWELTGSAYGTPEKAKIKAPSDELLSAQYDSPQDVPPEVMAWVRKVSIISGDATDAVRWSRIVDTQKDDRYSEGALTLYRAIGLGEEMIDEIRPGDWVTTSESYAKDHLRKNLNGKGSILEMEADGIDVLVSPTGNHEEAIYAPLEFSGPVKRAKSTRPKP